MAMLEEATELMNVDRVLSEKNENPHRLTPYIVTLCEGTVSEFDIRNFLEAGLRIVRFKMTHIARNDKVVLLDTLSKAMSWCRRKHEASTWPVAISIDLPNACIRTGYLKEELNLQRIYLEDEKTVEITSEIKYWNKCDDKKIFIDDPYTLATIKPNTEISIDFGDIIMVCTEVISNLRIKCKVIYGGYLSHGQFVCLRRVKLLRPSLARFDKQLLGFVKEYELDVVTIHCVRTAKTLEKVRAFFAGSKHMPMIMSTICEQEGLDNLDEIIAASDGIILAREFLTQSILNGKHLITIQLHVSGRCRQLRKPFYISGNILEEFLKSGTIACSEINDLTNAVLHGAGLILKSYSDAYTLLTTMKLINSVCKSVEPVSIHDNFWRLCMKPPVNAADAAVMACALTAKQSKSGVVVVLTVTGRTAVQLVNMEPETVILSVSTSPRVARRLQLYRGIMPVVYDRKPMNDWHAEMNARTQYAVYYGVKHDLLKYKQNYVILRKSTPTSAFCDQISVWVVEDEETKKKGMVCPESTYTDTQ